MSSLSQRVAHNWLTARVQKQTPTQMAIEGLRLPISDARFERAMEMAAKYMGGTYRNGTIRLPYRYRDQTFPQEMTVLYRKLPCGYITNRPADGACVSFDIYPNMGGDPRRSKIYKSFPATLKNSKTQFGKFLGWLRIVGDAVRRYVAQAEAGQTPQFARIAMSRYRDHERDPEQSDSSYRKEKQQMADQIRDDAKIPYAMGDKKGGAFFESVAAYVDRQGINMFGPSPKQWQIMRAIEKRHKKYFDMRPRSRGIAQAQKDAEAQNKADAKVEKDPNKDQRLRVLDQLMSKNPSNSFIRSIRDQLAKGKHLSDKQLKAVRQILYKNRMRAEADQFREAAKRIAAEWLAKQ